MGFSYSFIDNKLYGTEDINNITRNLTGAGVAPFVSKASYNVSDLNLMTSALVTAGVQLEGCRCTVEEIKADSISVKVAQGIVFFDCGVCITVDESGYLLDIPKNTKGYVYASYSPSLQNGDITFGAMLPADGEYVVLAEVMVNGRLIDSRVFARSKIATLGKNVSYKTSFTGLETPVLYREGTERNEYIVEKVEGVDIEKFNYVQIANGGSYVLEKNLVNLKSYNMLFFDLKENKIVYGIDGGTPWNASYFMYSVYHTIYPKKIDGELCMICSCAAGRINKNSYVTGSFAIFM